MNHGSSQGPTTEKVRELLKERIVEVPVEKIVEVYVPVEKKVKEYVVKKVYVERVPAFWEYVKILWKRLADVF